MEASLENSVFGTASRPGPATQRLGRMTREIGISTPSTANILAIGAGFLALLLASQGLPTLAPSSEGAVVAQALQSGGDLSDRMEATAAGPDRSYLPSQFISEIERAESSELPPQF